MRRPPGDGAAFRVGVVGARGHVGGELVPLLRGHPRLEVAWITSSRAAGDAVEGMPGLAYRAADPALLQREPVDAVVLALPNGESEPWVASAGNTVVVDLSADHRFDAGWVYAQPDRFGARIAGAKRLSCPGCYATAAQIAVAPFVDVAADPVTVFGVSGYSGAGKGKSEKNDPLVLEGNVLPYALVGHVHEKELRHHLGRRVHFMPHVAPFFRGLVVTVSLELTRGVPASDAHGRLAHAYRGHPFVDVTRDAPRPRDSVGKHGVRVGGVATGDDGTHLVVVAALDNLLGGAASQALRGLNLALGLDEGMGLSP